VYLSGFVGGFVNSSAAALLLTTVAMIARNWILLAFFSPSAVSTAAGPIPAMAVVALIFVQRARASKDSDTAGVHLVSPISLKRVPNFAGFFN
jgi:uncharacterized membrane protein (DUF4010 family)